MLTAGGQADVFLTYCTNAVLAQKEEPTLATIALPDSLAVGAEYGLVVLMGAAPAGQAFADYLVGPDGRRALTAAGFSPP